MQIPLRFVPIHTVDYLMTTVPPHTMQAIQDEVDAIEQSGFDPEKYQLMTNELVGAIDREFALYTCRDTVLDFLNQHIIPLYLERQGMPREQYTWSQNYNSRSFWVNFQDRNEYNPIHKHDGEISFVIWVRIPYTMRDEERKHTTAGKFNFHTQTDQGIKHHTIAADHEFEAHLIMFPSWLNHSVAPFATGEGYRVSVAGNLVKAA